MARDSLFGESIVWSGKPAVLRTPPMYRAIAVAAAGLSLVTLLFAVVAGLALGAHVGGMVVFAGWCATLALAAWRLPLVWQSRVEYLVTEKHVIWRRGPLRRTIDRNAISYARIVWSDSEPDVGDLVLVRAVPTGALRRTLTLVLQNVREPDRLWAVVRGVVPSAPLGDGDRPLAQRLDEGERVLWSAMPERSSWNTRRALTAFVSVALFGAAAQMMVRTVPSLHRVLAAHALGVVLSVLLVAGVALGTLLVVASAAAVGNWAVIRPARLARQTRYFVTNQRVLIRRGREELHLDRSRIAYVIAAPLGKSATTLSDVFLVLDGPQARALASSGAFGEHIDGDTLQPVFAAIADPETVGEILRAPRTPDRPSLNAA